MACADTFRSVPNKAERRRPWRPEAEQGLHGEVDPAGLAPGGA